MTKKENIVFFLDETKTHETEREKDPILIDFFHDIDSSITFDPQNHDLVPYLIDYQINYTVKQLLEIGEYYGIAKLCKKNHCSKEEIIHQLVIFENESENQDLVVQRKRMWFYREELKKDKRMKKYIL